MAERIGSGVEIEGVKEKRQRACQSGNIEYHWIIPTLERSPEGDDPARLNGELSSFENLVKLSSGQNSQGSSDVSPLRGAQ